MATIESSLDLSENTPLVKGQRRKMSDFEARGKDSGEKSGYRIFSALSGRRKYTLILITLATFLAGVSFSLLGPFYPIEAVKKGMSLVTVGIVFGIFEVVIFITAPFFGNYLVKLGPTFVFTTGIVVGGCCNILFGVLQYCPSGTPFLVMSIIIRSVEAIGFSGFITSSFAIVSSEFKENVGFTFGILETGSGLGFMLGPTIGGALFELGGFGAPFYFAGIAVLLNAIAVHNFLPAVEEIKSKRKGSMFTLLASPMIAVPVCSVLVGVIGITTYDSTFAKHLERIDLSVGIIGVLYGVTALVYSIMSSIWGYISDSKDIQSPLIVTGHLVFGVGFLLIGPSVFLPFIPFNLATILVGLALIGVSFGTTLIPTMKCMVIGATELGFENNIDTYAMVSGLFNSVHTLGGFIGPVGVGFLVQRFDYPVAYTVVGMCSFLMMFVSFGFFVVRIAKRRRVGPYRYKDVAETPSSSHAVDDFVSSGDAGFSVPYTRRRSLSVSV